MKDMLENFEDVHLHLIKIKAKIGRQRHHTQVKHLVYSNVILILSCGMLSHIEELLRFVKVVGSCKYMLISGASLKGNQIQPQ